MEKGWAEEARDVLLAGLTEHRAGYLPTEWIEAVARLGDPATHEDLLQYLRHGFNPSSTYAALSRAGLDRRALGEVVVARWRDVANGRTVHCGELEEMIALAMGHGHPDALAAAFLFLSEGEGWWGVGRVRAAIFRFTPAMASDEQLVAWFEDRRDRLVWDETARRWTIGGPGRVMGPGRDLP